MTLAVAMATGATALTRDAWACGGCATPVVVATPTSTTDHRMVLSLSPQQTVLWDQLRFAGDPKQFLWILPIRDGAAPSVEFAVGSNAFVDAMDTLSAPRIAVPALACGPVGPVVTPVTPQALDSGASNVEAPVEERARLGSVGRAVVGPYAAELVRGGEQPLRAWMRTRAFSVDAASAAVIEHYESLRFDFVVVQFRPSAGAQQIAPIRVRTSGYTPVLPLRFVSVGASDQVGLSLMVIAPTAMRPTRWSTAAIDDRDLSWSFDTRSSNYRDLLASASRGDDPPWVIESAQPIAYSQLVTSLNAVPTQRVALPSRGILPADCPFPDESAEPLRGPDIDGGPSERDASETDASETDGGDPRCVATGSSLPAPAAAVRSDGEEISAIVTERLVVTRLYIRLPRAGLLRDLELEPSDGDGASIVRFAQQWSPAQPPNACSPSATSLPLSPRGCACSAPAAPTHRGLAISIAAVTAALAFALTRRRTR